MARGNHQPEESLEELNLTPIMSILVILIPVLLFAFTFFEVKIQAVAAPRMGSSKQKEKDPDEKKPLNLTVLITEKGFVMKQQADSAEPELKIPMRTFEWEGESMEDYDYPALYNKLVEKKNSYPDEQILNVGAEPNIPWHLLARTIDGSRLRLEKDSYETMEDYAKAKPKKVGKGDLVELFPKVVFVVAE